MPAQRNSSAQLQLKVWWSFFIPYACVNQSSVIVNLLLTDFTCPKQVHTLKDWVFFVVKLNLKDDIF